MCVCVCVCADQQDGDCKCNSNHDLHVLLHQTDDSGGAGLQEETVMSLLIIILYMRWFYVSADVQLTFSETILNSPCCKHRYRCSLCLLRCSGRSLELVSSLMVRSPDHNTSAGRKSVDKSFPQTVDLFLQINHWQKWIITVHNSFISTSRIPMLSVFKNKTKIRNYWATNYDFVKIVEFVGSGSRWFFLFWVDVKVSTSHLCVTAYRSYGHF